MHLPEELLDEIFGRLPPNDRRSLQNCSLVSKSWLQPGRRLLFAHVVVKSATYRSWLDNISPTNTGLLCHARSLTYIFGDGCGISLLRDYLPSFFQLQQLAFSVTDIESTICDHLEWFSAFRHTLSSLSLSQVSITWSAFIVLVGYFPNLRDLHIFKIWFRKDDWPVPCLPHALRGRLLVSFGTAMRFPFDRLVGLKLEYEEVEVDEVCEACLVAAVERTLKRLKMGPLYSKSTLSLSRCPELCQLEIITMHPQEQERILISSITSTSLRKIIFAPVTKRITWGLLWDHPCWMPFDDMICGFVDRLQASGYKHTLELEFRVNSVELGEEVHRKDFLPKFREKGLVRIVEVLSERVWELP
ncbi:hypothetical protein BDM02DRAFT_3269711 [Thelephora ganbajun]|uniref:Uncharacterized protein n=1 Tax=Thelephora ganbajun TaxID=370292 RepID=A0ACB6ZEV9_THEGA|nr:hypothetical protein BDM02DRAFT_3269711 [Thelephora ganbajun]